MNVIEPKSSKEFKKYYGLRYEILRKPWNQPPGSEKDEDDKTSIHRMIVDNSSEIVIAIGRLQFNSIGEAQIRYMAVALAYQGRGLGSQIITNLEKNARESGTKRMILHARENALQFYIKNGYEIVNKSYVLFDEIQHWHMLKKL